MLWLNLYSSRYMNLSISPFYYSFWYSCAQFLICQRKQYNMTWIYLNSVALMLLSKALYFFYKTSYIYLLITFCGGSHKLLPSLSETWSVIHSWIIWVTHIWANWLGHYGDVIMDAIESQITSLTIIYSLVYSDVHQRKHQSSASLAFVREFTGDRWIPRTSGQ